MTYTQAYPALFRRAAAYGCSHAKRVTPARLRDELTDLWVRASAGEQLVAAGVHQAPVLTAPCGGVIGVRAELTVFRRQVIASCAGRPGADRHRGGDPMPWLGPVTALPAGSGSVGRWTASPEAVGTARERLSPSERALRGRRSPSAASTHDSRRLTERARASFMASFERQVIPMAACG